MLGGFNLNALVYFEAVARLGQVSKAAEELGVSPSAVSQQIHLLEQQFGVRLFRREKRSLRLTLDGEGLFRTTTQALRLISDARGAIARQRKGRQFVLRVSPSIGVRWLGPRLKGFVDLNPGWDMRIDASPDFSDFETEAVDIDLRYGTGDWSGLHTEAVIHDQVLPMGAPSYLDTLRSRGGTVAEQLAAARLIDSTKAVYRWDYWLSVNGFDCTPREYPLRFDRSSMAIQLAKDGGGIILESVTLAYNELARRELVPLSTDLDVIEFPAYWLVCPARHTNRRIVRIFSDWLRAEGQEQLTAARNLLVELGCKHYEDESGMLAPPPG